MFDTHCHLNFKTFKKNVEDVIAAAQQVGVTRIVVPGTDIKTSRQAVEISAKHSSVFAAVGIHPHHVFQYLMPNIQQQPGAPSLEGDLQALEGLLKDDNVVAVGEIGLDRHVYEDTKYAEYVIDEQFMSLQIQLLRKQIGFAVGYDKSLILHNREAKHDMLRILDELWDAKLEHRSVFHCCEPDTELLAFAKNHHMFIGIDGDITYTPEKQAFIQQVPIEMLVLETDSPFLLPEPLKSQKKYPNNPANIPLIAGKVAEVKQMDIKDVASITEQNSMKLFMVELP